MGQELHLPTKKVQDYTIDIGKKIFGKGGSASKNMQWPAMLRKLERETINDWRQ